MFALEMLLLSVELSRFRFCAQNRAASIFAQFSRPLYKMGFWGKFSHALLKYLVFQVNCTTSSSLKNSMASSSLSFAAASGTTASLVDATKRASAVAPLRVARAASTINAMSVTTSASSTTAITISAGTGTIAGENESFGRTSG